ncbi:uncharacterized protein LOC120336804 [Styela clava]
MSRILDSMQRTTVTAELGSAKELNTFQTNNFYGNQSDDYNCLIFPQELVIISQVASLFVGVISIYVVFSLSLHHFRAKRNHRKAGWISRRTSTVNPDQEKNGKLFKKIMNLQMINAAFCIAVRCALDFGILQAGHIRNPEYVTFSRIEILLNIAALSSMYLVLWLRQWSFYNHPAMNEGKFKKLRIICILLLFVMIATGVWNAVAFLLERDIKIDEMGCIQTDTSGNTMIKFYILGACTLFYQIVLLTLFAYPLALHARKNISSECSRRRSVMRVIRRVFIATLLCCFTDLLATVLSVVLENAYPDSSFIVYNFNVAGNFLCLMYTFSDWRLRLFYPFIMCKRTVPASWKESMTMNSNASISQTT